MLIKYLKTLDVRVVWTFHDCWNFSGSAAHFDFYGCNEWDQGCRVCNNTNVYPKAVFRKERWKKLFFFFGFDLTNLIGDLRKKFF